MLVSILINNYNYGIFLRDAIDSALRQSYPNVEVVVVDDGSTDDSRDIIASYGKRITPVLKTNGGHASTFNAGFAASHGDIICLLDSDDLFLPDKAEQLVRVYKMEQEYSWCFDRLLWVDTRLQAIPGGSEQGSTHECDFRSDVRRGRLFFNAPATSGLSFRRSFLANLMPLPEAEGFGVGDEYLKIASLGLSRGYYLAQGYTLQRIHSGNAFTARPERDRLKLKSYIQLTTSCALAGRFPELRRFTDKQFAKAVALCWLAGGMSQVQRSMSSNYLSFTALRHKIGVISRAGYHLARYFVMLRLSRNQAPPGERHA